MNFKFCLISFLLGLSACQSSSPVVLTPAARPIQVHGHRGSRGTHPENSFPAFEEAVSAGVRWVELDLVLSKENIPVISHDPTISVDLCLDAQKKPLLRLIPIKLRTLKQLKTFDCGSVPNPLFPEQKPVPGSTFLTLEEVLAWASKQPADKVRFNIETKIGSPKLVESVIRLLRKYHQIENSILQSFDFKNLSVAKKMEPSLRLSALFEKPADICKTIKELGAQIASPSFSLVTPSVIQECHASGIEVHPWTLNQESEWRSAIALGVDGIITDYPRKLISFLNVRPSP